MTCANLLVRCPWHPPALTSRCGNALPPISLPVPPKSSAGGPRLLVLSRLCYRKGTDLLVDILPRILARHPNLKTTIGERMYKLHFCDSFRCCLHHCCFLVAAGDGPKAINVLECVEGHGLEDRVDMLGRVERSDVFDVLSRGGIFLNCR